VNGAAVNGAAVMKHAGIAVLVLALAGCSAPAMQPAMQPASSTSTADELSGTVTVFAAASLSETFTELADEFMAENPAVSIQFSFGGSSGLAQQIIEGAPADVFAAASPATMALVTDAGVAATPVTFAANYLEIAVPAGNPGGVHGVDDFARPDLAIALCAVEVPCGAASAAVFADGGIVPSVDTYEQDVKAVLTKITLGEVDAGLVYVTDVMAAGAAVEGIALDSNPVDYPIATLTDSAAAQAFVDYVRGTKGQAVLAAAGFVTP
jgi:molybdate transport system substrate-binding protein